LAVFLILIPVLFKKSLNHSALSIFGTIGTGIYLFYQYATAFHGATGSTDIPLAIVISRFAAFAGFVQKGTACPATGATTPNQGNLRCEVIIGVCLVHVLKMCYQHEFILSLNNTGGELAGILKKKLQRHD